MYMYVCVCIYIYIYIYTLVLLDIKRYVACRYKEKWLEEGAAWNIKIFNSILCRSVVLGKLTVV